MLKTSESKDIITFPLYLLIIFFILYNPYPLPFPLVENLTLEISVIISSVRLVMLFETFIICFSSLNSVKILICFLSLLLAASIALFNKLLNTTVSSLSSNGIHSNWLFIS